MDCPTSIAVGSVTVVANSPDTNALFQDVAATIANLRPENTYTYGGDPIPSPGGNGESVLFIPATATGTVTVPGGYGYVVIDERARVSLSNDDAGTVVIGDGFDFEGLAKVVASGAGLSRVLGAGIYRGSGTLVRVAGTGTIDAFPSSTVVASAGSNATISALAGSHTSDTVSVQGTATADVSIDGGTVKIDSGATTTVTVHNLSYSGSRVTIGTDPTVVDPRVLPPGPPITPTKPRAAAMAPRAVGFTNVITTDPDGGSPYSANTYAINDAGSVNMISLGSRDRVDSYLGLSTLFGRAANTIKVHGPGGVFFVGGPDVPPSGSVQGGASTVSGGAGSSTVFATAGDQFNVGSGPDNVFVGGAAASTINAGGGGGSFFGGAHGDQYYFGTSDAQVFVGTGGADTLSGSTRNDGTVAPVIYAENSEHLTLTGATPATVVAFTADGQVDLSLSTGDNVVFAGFGVGGNETLVCAPALTNAGTPKESLVLGANPHPFASTLTIENWHPGDAFHLTGFGQSDWTTMGDAIIGAEYSGALSFTLGDQTTVTFVGQHPLLANGNFPFGLSGDTAY